MCGNVNLITTESEKYFLKNNNRSRPSGEEDTGGYSVKAETPLMKVGNFLKASSLASLHNFGWRRETSV